MIPDDELLTVNQEQLCARRHAIGIEAGRVQVIADEVGDHDRKTIEGTEGTRKERRVDAGFISRCDQLRPACGLDSEKSGVALWAREPEAVAWRHSIATKLGA
jgi:hypothetical protein